MDNIKGILIPIGGNEHKGKDESENYSLDFIEEGILSHVVRESGGKEAKIVIVPTASSIPIEVSDNYLAAFDLLGCKNLDVLNIQKRSQSEEKRSLKLLEDADCVMFSGGNQSKIVDFMAGTKAHSILSERYKSEKFVIAGTSAGAMSMSDHMVAGGSSQESLVKGAVKMRRGMGYIHDLIIDTHFIRRGRFGRLAEAVAMHPNLLGLGLAEDTGIIIRNGNYFQVIGSGMVILFDPSALAHNSHQQLPEGTPISMSNLVVHILANSDSFILDKRKIEILPLEAGFI
ncbi:MAG: cyanophycinase [Vicingaceae bacterium]